MTTNNRKEITQVLVTGATGYVGGRLVPQLLASGYQVRVLARDPTRLQGRFWSEQIEIVQGDVLKPETLAPALQGVDAAYYLIHSLKGSDDFHQRDLQAARHFGEAADQVGVQRIIYLGGLGSPEAELSEHLRSRQETGEALRESDTPVVEFRAAIVVGAGSVSFEMIRYLTERLPVMVCPQWVYTRVQPIGIENVLEYLEAGLNVEAEQDQIIEIGGRDVLTYGEMMLQYAEVRGLRRVLLPVPVLSPRLSSYWIHWVTPIPSSIAKPLIEGLRNEVVVTNDDARRLFPAIKPLDYKMAVRRALDNLEAATVETTWNDALTTSQGDLTPVVLTTHEGMMIEKRERIVEASAATVFATVTALGGSKGWPYFNMAWRLRGILDRLVGGVGFRRGRRHPQELRPGDVLDFWRVEAVELNRRLLLRAEMRVPGRAWLQFEMQPEDSDNTKLIQTAFFASKGLFGFLYWYGLYPIHALIFSGMIRKLAEQSETSVEQSVLA